MATGGGLSSSKSMDAGLLPAPRFTLFSKPDTGLAADTTSVLCDKTLIFHFSHVPDMWFDAAYDLRLQMGRWKATHTATIYAATGNYRKKKGAGYYYPTANSISGAALPHDHGTLHGDHPAISVARPNYWQVSSVGRYGTFHLHTREFAAPYFKMSKYFEDVGGGIYTLKYMSGKARMYAGGRRRVSGHNINGRFVFRFMAKDQATGKWLFSDTSNVVVVGNALPTYLPRQTFVIDNTGSIVATGQPIWNDFVRGSYEMRLNQSADGVSALNAWFERDRGNKY